MFHQNSSFFNDLGWVDDGIDEDEPLADYMLDVDENDYVQIYQYQVTFEHAATLPGTLQMFLDVVQECDYPNVAAEMDANITILENSGDNDVEVANVLCELRPSVLRAAERSGKGYPHFYDELKELQVKLRR